MSGGTSNEATATIDVKSKSEDCSVYQNLVLGDWSVSHTAYPDDEPYKLVIYENGYGRYIWPGPDGANRSGVDENGDSYYNISWSITEKDFGCMFLERGFWHFGYDSIPRTLLANPITFVATHDGNYENYGIIYTKN